MTELFKTQEDIESAKAHFKTLKYHAGWQLLVSIVEENIKVLEEQLLNGFDEETKEEIDRKRDKLRAYKEVIGTPDFWISKFESSGIVEDDSDPYYKVDKKLN